MSKISVKNMNIKDLILYMTKFENIDDILDKFETQSEKGCVFERLFDIVIKFGFCDIFPRTEFNYLTGGNSNNAKLKILENFDKYLYEKVNIGNSSGCSDITLQNKNTKEFIFTSSKFPKSQDDIKKQKYVKYYEIQDIVAMISKNKHIYNSYKIYIIVQDKKKVLTKVQNANTSSGYITDHMKEENILDKNDLNKYFLLFKQDIIKNINEDWNDIYLKPKDNLNLRFHQELITQKTSDLIEKGNKSFLWGCKCRSGKTYMVGGIVIKQFNIKKKVNILIITPLPTETTPQFTDDLFNKFKDFDKFKIHNIKGSENINSLELGNNNIFIISKQTLGNYINNETIQKIKNLKLDIIVFDENHFIGTTDKSKDILSSYSSKNTVNIYLTATYNKPLKTWYIPYECQMFWDTEDEQTCKSILLNENNLDKLKDKHNSDYINKTLKYYNSLGLSINDIFKPYEKMPELHLLTNMFDSERYKIIKERLNIGNSKMGLSFNTLFSLNKSKTKFTYENEVKTILRYISGSHKEEDGDETIFPRINKICSDKETRLPFTQVWFLPSSNIKETSECLKQLMEQDLILKKYDILCVNRKDKDLAKDIKDEIDKKEKEALSKGKLGIIILSGKMLSLGITLSLCDLVILMNDSLLADKVFQQMFRCMTEGLNKKIGFVFDLNINRVLNTIINYTIYKNEKTIEDKIKYIIENRLINIDIDMMKNKKINSDTIIKKLMDIWKENPINSFNSLMRNLEKDYEDYDNQTQKLINNYFTKNIKDDKINIQVILKDENDEIQKLPTGVEKVKIDDEKLEKEEKKEINISFTKDVLPYIIPLACILTIKDSNMNFVRMLNYIKENPKLLDTFNDQCLIWWNKKDLIDLIKDIVNKYFDKNSNTYNISIQFKMSLHSLIDNPKELLELINDCLKPKDIEKKKFGEVFTPMNLVNEMLYKLPSEVWNNKHLKWLDPCCGMGNFPVAVYLRLMIGLEEEIKDTSERKKHILENMLYMSELNKKNVMICKQIFDINNELKLNIYEGDSLKVDYNNEFGIKHFDIITGNPPYNASGTKATGNTIWQLFVNNSIKLLKPNGYICFVHPNGWRKPNTERGKLYGLFEKMIKENTMLYLEIHDAKDGMKQFNCGTRYDWYILQKKKNENYKTKILDQNNISYEINLNKYNWLANCELELIDKLIANENEEKCSVLYTRNNYGSDKKWTSNIETKEFKYPVLHSTPKDKPRYIWSNINNNGHYGIKKVMFGYSGMNNPIIDIDGKYALSECAIGIIINNEIEGQKISKFLVSNIFSKILKACLWSSFRIEWGMFKDLKKNFYELLDDKKIETSKIIEQDNIKNKEEKNNKIEYEIIKDGRKKTYLIDNKLYKVKRDGSVGVYVSNYMQK